MHYSDLVINIYRSDCRIHIEQSFPFPAELIEPISAGSSLPNANYNTERLGR